MPTGIEKENDNGRCRFNCRTAKENFKAGVAAAFLSVYKAEGIESMSIEDAKRVERIGELLWETYKREQEMARRERERSTPRG